MKKKPKAEKESLVVVNLKMPASERRRMIQSAKKYTRGNLSAWLRAAGRAYRPTDGELDDVKAPKFLKNHK